MHPMKSLTYCQLALCLLALCLSTIVSPQISAQTQYPLTITDDLGRSLTLKQPPQRISSKSLFTDELLIELIPQTQLTSVTQLATDSGYSNVAEAINPHVQKLDLNVEAILANQPDLVFAANWSDSARIAQLRQAGIAVYCIDTPMTPAAISDRIETLGMLLDQQAEAEQLIERFNTRLSQLSVTAENITAKQWVALDYNSWGTANGRNTTWQSVLDGAGLINGAAQFEQGAFGQVALSKELIVAVNPDVLFLPGSTTDSNAETDRFYQQVLNDPALQGVNAIIHGRVYRVPERLRGTYSHYMADTIEYVINAVGRDADI